MWSAFACYVHSWVYSLRLTNEFFKRWYQWHQFRLHTSFFFFLQNNINLGRSLAHKFFFLFLSWQTVDERAKKKAGFLNSSHISDCSIFSGNNFFCCSVQSFFKTLITLSCDEGTHHILHEVRACRISRLFWDISLKVFCSNMHVCASILR